MKILVLLNVLLPDRGGCLKINDGGKKKKELFSRQDAKLELKLFLPVLKTILSVICSYSY